MSFGLWLYFDFPDPSLYKSTFDIHYAFGVQVSLRRPPFYTFTLHFWTESKPSSPIGVVILAKWSVLILQSLTVFPRNCPPRAATPPAILLPRAPPVAELLPLNRVWNTLAHTANLPITPSLRAPPAHLLHRRIDWKLHHLLSRISPLLSPLLRSLTPTFRLLRPVNFRSLATTRVLLSFVIISARNHHSRMPLWHSTFKN